MLWTSLIDLELSRHTRVRKYLGSKQDNTFAVTKVFNAVGSCSCVNRNIPLYLNSALSKWD